ncbi:MAG: DUF721 domain-containing protein [Muribaculaceae bacterium]|nr:DUF721 domain-containing protein [Muribaculaceae bacterium]
MERRDVVTVGDVLRECLEKSSMQGRLDEVRACDSFRVVVGDYLASMCRQPYMKNGVMTIGTSNASLRSDLNMRRGTIANAINEILGKEVVKEILFKN